MLQRCVAFGREVPPELIGELRDSRQAVGDAKTLRARLRDEGYVFLRGVLDRAEVIAARDAVFERLAAIGEIAEPYQNGIATGTSRRRELHSDLGSFWKTVVDMPAVRRVTNGARLHEIMGLLFGEPARGMDYIFLRAGANGRATGLHYDFPFFTRHTQRVCTAWIPFGPVAMEDGPVMIVEGSMGFRDILDHLRGFDVAVDKNRRAEVSHDPVGFAEARGCKLRTADFMPGDVFIFGMFLMHGALENHNTNGRVRLSCDVRYQPACDPLDPRYFGPDPAGTFGGGYGELNGAKPLTEEWHRR